MEAKSISTTCCIVGAGPCGLMLGFLLARRGIDVTVIEKHNDFFRDFRGDTIHPSTMEILHEAGILHEFLKIPHDKVSKIEADFGSKRIVLADFSHLHVHEPYVAFMPQWDFLDFISRKAKEFKNFHLLMNTGFKNLLDESGEITGIVATQNDKEVEIKARITIGADGRHSLVRKASRLRLSKIGVPIDVMWFRISRRPHDPKAILAKVNKGKIMIMLDRTTYWQCAFVIPKSHFKDLQEEGMESFKESILDIAPFLKDSLHEIKSWENIKLLTVEINRLDTWYKEGLLLLGDAAHAMSPIGGVGVNLAVQDAVAAANILGPKILGGDLQRSDLKKVQDRREFPTKVVQSVQSFAQDKIHKRILTSHDQTKPPTFMKMIGKFPILRRVPARIVGIGVRPEHLRF